LINHSSITKLIATSLKYACEYLHCMRVNTCTEMKVFQFH